MSRLVTIFKTVSIAKMYRHFEMLLLICLATLSIVFGAKRVDPLVETKVGLIRGLSATDGDYSMFMGIPYATVDEANPFGSAFPFPPFEDAFEAYDDSAICPQIEELNNSPTGSLDCLHLNIYVPDSASSSNRLPVLVWIHGGGFSIGFAGRNIYGPKFLMKHDVILVTINYRLGPYGFMCLDIPEVPGNQGFKDQYLALKWIHENIAGFGGDPDKVTIFGESAGAMAIDFHLLSPQEKVFSKAIIHSGTSLSPTFYEPVKDAPLILAGYLGHDTDDVYSAISFLASVDTSMVIAAVAELNMILRPCVEQEFENVDRFITENWINAEVPKVKNVPILIGFNSEELLFNYGIDNIDYYEKRNLFNDELSLGFDIDDERFADMEEMVRHFYIGDEEISEQVKWQLMDFQSDFTFNHPTLRTIKKYIENGSGDIFSFLFSYSGDRNFIKYTFNITTGGASHADEIGYLFDVSILEQNQNPDDLLLVDRITTMWTNFVKYSNPTPELSDLLPVKWTPITKGSPYHYIEINSELSSKSRPYSKRMTFWDLFYKTNKDLQRIYPGGNVV